MEAVTCVTDLAGTYSMKSCTSNSSNWNTVGMTCEVSRPSVEGKPGMGVERVGDIRASPSVDDAAPLGAAPLKAWAVFGCTNSRPVRSSSMRAASATRRIIVAHAVGRSSCPEACKMPKRPSQTRARTSSCGTRNKADKWLSSCSCAASWSFSMARAPFFSASPKIRQSEEAAMPRKAPRSPRSSAAQESETRSRTPCHIISKRGKL
mmetsp:Transcript_59298/g.171847  ORF Transcript_59298/g.171847 Transcript_59298/m.171847 type:complete len:207 (-) Transcript_59298:588-1208(-)